MAPILFGNFSVVIIFHKGFKSPYMNDSSDLFVQRPVEEPHIFIQVEVFCPWQPVLTTSLQNAPKLSRCQIVLNKRPLLKLLPTDRRTDGPTNQRTNGPTTRLLELLWTAKNPKFVRYMAILYFIVNILTFMGTLQARTK